MEIFEIRGGYLIMGLCLKINEQIYDSKNFGKANIVKYGYLNYIQGDGASYIDTGFSGYRNNYGDIASQIPSDAPKIEITIKKNSAYNEYVVATRDGRGNMSIQVNPSEVIISGKGAIGKFQVNEVEQDINIIYGSVKTFVNGKAVKDNTDMSNQYRLNAYSDNNITLLGGKANPDTQVFTTNMIKEFKAYEGEKLVLHLRPYRKKDGTVCMIDEVTKTFHYNAGTGTLIGI